MAYTFSFNASFKEAKKNLDAYNESMRNAFEKTSESIQDVFNRKNKKIEENFFGSSFHTSFKQRMQATLNSLNEAQNQAAQKMSNGDAFGARNTSEKATLKTTQELMAANKLVMDSILKQNMGRQRSLRMMRQQVDLMKVRLQTQKALAQSQSDAQFNSQINSALQNGQPIGSLQAAKQGENDRIGQSYDKLIAALDSNREQHSKAYDLAKRSEASKDRFRRIKSAVGGVASAGRGALAATGLASITGIAGIATAFIAEGMKLDRAVSSVSGLNANIQGGGQRFGLTNAEFIEKGREGMILGGRANYDFRSQLEMERGFSMNDGALNGLASQSRLTGNKGESAATITKQIIATMRSNELGGMRRGQGRSTYVNLGEKVDQVNSLLATMSEQMKETNVESATGLLALINKSGYDDQRAGQIAQSINSGITNPGDDYKQAFVLRSISEKNPGMDIYDLFMQQEKGIGDITNVEAQLEGIQKRFGSSNKAGGYQLSKLFSGITQEQGRDIMTLFNKGGKGGEESAIQEVMRLAKEGEGLDIEGDAKGSDGTVQQAVAGVRNFLADNGKIMIDGMVNSMEYMRDTFKDGVPKGMSKMWNDAISGLKEFFDSGKAQEWGRQIGEAAKKAMLGPKEKESWSKVDDLGRTISKYTMGSSITDYLYSDTEKSKNERKLEDMRVGQLKFSEKIRGFGEGSPKADSSNISMADGKQGYSKADSDAFEKKLGEVETLAQLTEYIYKLTEEMKKANQMTKRNNLTTPTRIINQ